MIQKKEGSDHTDPSIFSPTFVPSVGTSGTFCPQIVPKELKILHFCPQNWAKKNRRILQSADFSEFIRLS